MEAKLKIFNEYLEYSRLDSKDYQKEGVRWCLSKELARNPLQDVRGGIIADEMGLGKTITMIGMMMANFMPKTLIVLPVALLDQWWTTIERTTGHKAVIYHGASNKKKYTKADLETKPVVLTTYGTIVLDAKKNDKLSKITCFKPGGAFYAFPNISKTGLNGKEFSDIALEQKGVALVPGTSFGDKAQNFVRISFANSLDNIKEAIKRISTI